MIQNLNPKILNVWYLKLLRITEESEYLGSTGIQTTRKEIASCNCTGSI